MSNTKNVKNIKNVKNVKNITIESNGLESLSKAFNTIENYVAKYIYKKYIEEKLEDVKADEKADVKADEKADTTDDEDTVDIYLGLTQYYKNKQNPQTEVVIIQDITKPTKPYRYNMKPLDNIKYISYLNTIFIKKRKCIITQIDILEMDLAKMKIVDAIYNTDPSRFRIRDYDCLPDVKRCTFIRKHKNKYIRCCNLNMNDDEDVCYRHINIDNIYWDTYNKILEVRLQKLLINTK